MRPSICVIGAGVVGLSTAFRIIEEYGADNVNIVVVADKFYNETTTYGCGGLWEPYQIAGTPDELVNAWGEKSFNHFLQLLYSPHGNEAGVQLLQAFQIFEAHEVAEVPPWHKIALNFKSLTKEDIEKMNLPKKYVKGFTFSTLVIEQKYYLQYLTRELTKAGVVFEQRKIDSIDEFKDSSFDAVINCSGLGSFEILNDKEMYPIRGQVLRVNAPWMNNVWFFGSSYIIPQMSSVVLGGTAQKGDWNTNVSVQDTKKIMDDICAVFPSLRNAQIENIWVGLRPGRAPLRLNSEVIRKHDGSEVTIVHCYGHGGSGVTIGMGCADDVVKNHLVPALRQLKQSVSSQEKLSNWVKHRSRL